jgi:hypothetical protein
MNSSVIITSISSLTYNYPAASCGVSKTARNEASFGEYDPERLKKYFDNNQDLH